MRRFLYLNNDSLYSYISQINDGLPTNFVNNFNNLEESSNEKKSNVNGEIDGNFKFLDKGISATLNGALENNRKKSTINELSHSVEKKLYDEAFDKLEKYLQDNSLIKENDLIIGDFLKIKDEMFIVDLEYYKNIFSSDTVLSFIKENELNVRITEENKKTENSGNNKKEKYDSAQLMKKIKKEIDNNYEYVKKLIDAMINIVPYNKFGIMGEYLVVLDDEYFRDQNKVVAYKYGGKMTMLGYLTNIVNNNNEQNDENIFRTLPSLINNYMLLFFRKSEIKIVHPIAIYY